MSELRKEAEALGIEVDGRWSDKRLQKEIDAVKSPEEGDQPVDNGSIGELGPENGGSNDGSKPAKAGVTVRNARPNLLDLKCVEIAGFAEAELTVEQMADKRVQRALEIGVLVEV